MQGSLTLNLHAAIDGDTTTLAADGTVGVTGGQPQASALVGDDGRLELAATLHGNDRDPVAAAVRPDAPPRWRPADRSRRTGSTCTGRWR